MKTINIKKDHPTSDYAIFKLEKEIEYCKAEGHRVLLVIHGYGSHGVGGEIKQRTKELLESLKKSKKIVDYICGQDWSETNPLVKKIYELAPELLISSQVRSINSGVTVVYISK